MERIFLASALVLSALSYLQYMHMEGPSIRKALIKCVPGLMAFICALLGACRHHSQLYAYLIAAGLLLCSAADYLLEFSFIRGIAAFGSAHLLFVAGFLFGCGLRWESLLLFVCIYAVLFAVFFRYRQRTPGKLPFFAFALYAFLLSLMTALAVGAGLWYALGAALFAFSDIILGLRLFGIYKNRPLDYVLMAAYDLSLLFLAAGNCL